MINEENKNQQPEITDFSIENFLSDENKQSVQKQQNVNKFSKPEIDEEAIMRVMAGEEPIETERTKTPLSNSKKMTSKSRKLTKEDYCGQFFKIPTTIASKGKSVYVRQEHHDKFNRFTNSMGIDKLTIYAYLDNIIEHHFQEFGELITEIYNEKNKPLF
jgi:arginine deiminase